MEILDEDKYKDSTFRFCSKRDESSLVALSNIRRLLRNSERSDNVVDRAIARIQFIDSVQAILGYGNKVILFPEEEYILKPAYRAKRKESRTRQK